MNEQTKRIKLVTRDRKVVTDWEDEYDATEDAPLSELPETQAAIATADAQERADIIEQAFAPLGQKTADLNHYVGELQADMARIEWENQQKAAATQEPQEPKLISNLESAKLERDDVRTMLREAKQEEATLKHEKATSKDLKVAAVASEALKILANHDDFRSIPALTERLEQAEAKVQTYETRLRDERTRGEPFKKIDPGRASFGSAEDRS